jgi:hypothetical protein
MTHTPVSLILTYLLSVIHIVNAASFADNAKDGAEKFWDSSAGIPVVACLGVAILALLCFPRMRKELKWFLIVGILATIAVFGYINYS